MSLLKVITGATAGALGAVALVTALPIAGAVGTITATGAAVSSTVGGVIGAAESMQDEE